MGIAKTQDEESERRELEDFRQTLVALAARERSKENEDLKGLMSPDTANVDLQDKLVCVTSGVSFLGVALVNRLLIHGYSVRILVHNQDDVERLREMQVSGEMMVACSNKISVVMAKPTEIQGLTEAFDGCRGVFHTSAFADPAGISGYSKYMAEIEVKASENVMKACARTASVKNCVLTSSLLSCIWRDSHQPQLPTLVNHDCWSSESLCMDKKLWFALGKLKAEKVAWKIAEEMSLKLTTICPGLITGPEFSHRNPTVTIAYLKGAQEMYGNGLLASVDVIRLAEAHVCVYEAMNKTASGRYICFDRIIERDEEAEKLATEIGMPAHKICGNSLEFIPIRFQLSNKKLNNLMSTTPRNCYAQS
ncbi:cinnamoyl-CoA reductase 2-like isoform X2 [Hibiscus syriacus]|uniref:Cinnamoyl-CoA reductase 2-like isoform X2 n=1 Tax=Hibiscus syriacus TaxID=106335 RepID=A0A6A3C335_HIBSY|nr:cinnamoyl-CoA reductase-like SNL6 [Hibiscus syriacus]KAE8722028.1 cinnamoyl-CoA reductase 2-like isoform X2 [Hibiscus syriacus]